MYDLCVIGGGASGMSCAIAAGRLGKKVLLIEKNNKLGKKLYATGNGKCNLTNSIFDASIHYNSTNNEYSTFVTQALNNAYSDNSPNQQIIEFMESLGVDTMNDNNYIYPSSAQASSVVWAMIDELKALNIEIRLNTKVISIEGKSPSFLIKCENEAFNTSKIALAAGGMAYSTLGGSESGYELSKKYGHNILKPRASLCGLVIKEDISELAGVRANAKITLNNSKTKDAYTSLGELQFTKQGLSGICIFELSSKVGKLLYNSCNPLLSISLLDYPKEESYNNLIELISCNKNCKRTVVGLLNGFVNDKIANYICKINNINPKAIVNDVDSKQLIQLATNLNNLSFNVTNLYDLEQAQVTAGGVDIDEINPYNMESKLVKDVYIVGELLDIDGICGGYNLTFAMLTGYKAGKSIC